MTLRRAASCLLLLGKLPPPVGLFPKLRQTRGDGGQSLARIKAISEKWEPVFG
jgi:hypothetical protein